MCAFHEEEVARAGVDAGRHAERDRADRAHHLPGLADQPLHVRGRETGAPLVTVAGEEKEEGVPAKLEHVAAVALADPDQALEDAGDGEHQLLGARAALSPGGVRTAG